MKLSTTPTAKNIATVLEALQTIPPEFTRVVNTLTPAQIQFPLGEGEWSCQQVLQHLQHTFDVSLTRIEFALMLDNPVVPVVHAEHDWGKLRPYQALSTSQLLTLYELKNQKLLHLLTSLDQAGWERPFLKGEPRHNLHNIYREARGMALHEHTHLTDLQAKIAQYF